MAIKLKSTDVIVRKYVARAGQAGGDYKDGVQNPRRDQGQAAIAANDTYKTAMQESLNADRFVKGVQGAGDKWARKAAGIGAQRYPAGVQAAAPDYQNGVQPFLDVIAGVTLPPRFPRGDPRNVARVQAVDEALRRKAVGA